MSQIEYKVVPNGLFARALNIEANPTQHAVSQLVSSYAVRELTIDNIGGVLIPGEIRRENNDREFTFFTGPDGIRLLHQAMEDELERMINNRTTIYTLPDSDGLIASERPLPGYTMGHDPYNEPDVSIVERMRPAQQRFNEEIEMLRMLDELSNE